MDKDELIWRIKDYLHVVEERDHQNPFNSGVRFGLEYALLTIDQLIAEEQVVRHNVRDHLMMGA